MHNLAVAPPRLRVDLTPLRTNRAFRVLFTGGLVTSLGSMVTYVVIPLQIQQLTGSYIAVGLVGAVELVPLIVFGLYGGSLADRLDRKRMVIIGELTAGLIVAGLAINSLQSEPKLAVIYVAAMLLATVDGLQRPSLEAILPRIVTQDELAAASALNSLRMNMSAIAGPAIAGVLVVTVGPAAAFGIDAASFAVSALILMRLPAIAARRDGSDDGSLRHIWTGVRYAMSRRDILGTYAIDVAAMTFAFPFALFPFVAEEFDAPWALGLLYSAGFVGGALFGLTSGWTSRIHRHGRAIALSAALWGAAIGLIALSPNIVVVLVLLAVAGYFDMMSGLFRSVMWNQSIPDEMRGRMAGIELLSYSVGPTLGQIRSTTAAQLTGLRTSFATGGIMCIAAVGVVCWTMPALWRYDASTDINVQRRRDEMT